MYFPTNVTILLNVWTLACKNPKIPYFFFVSQ